MADYLEGDLPLGKRALFDAHLAQCPDCSSELAEMRGTIALLRRLPTPEPPADLTDNVMRRIAAGEGKPGLLDHLERWIGDLRSLLVAPNFAVPASALAAGLAVVFVTADGGRSLPGFGATSPVVQVPRAEKRPKEAALPRPRGKQTQGVAGTSARLREEFLNISCTELLLHHLSKLVEGEL